MCRWVVEGGWRSRWVVGGGWMYMVGCRRWVEE